MMSNYTVTGGSISAHPGGGCSPGRSLAPTGSGGSPCAGAGCAPYPPGAGSRLCRTRMLRGRLTHIVSCQLSCGHLSLMIARIQSPTPGNGLLPTLCRVGDAGGRCLLTCFPNPSRAPSTPALYIALVLFLKPLEGQRAYTSQLRQHFSLIYKRHPPSIKEKPCKSPGN